MTFTKRLRDGVRRGEITCSVRIWTRLHVKVGGRYPMEEGEIEVDSIEPIGFPDITPQLARESGFLGIIDLLKVAKHGKGDRIYLIRFHYVPPRAQRGARRAAPASKPEATTTRQQTQAARSPATRQSRKKSPVFGAEQSKRR
ncbi:MAG TPA: ASCH domain-containing protein [Bryobacteraceae bacterium]|nr:ASCH domain-containing protein [Bryobacteraceae bacterium]